MSGTSGKQTTESGVFKRPNGALYISGNTVKTLAGLVVLGSVLITSIGTWTTVRSRSEQNERAIQELHEDDKDLFGRLSIEHDINVEQQMQIETVEGDIEDVKISVKGIETDVKAVNQNIGEVKALVQQMAASPLR
jgi:uncharacterized protein HemX